MSFPIKDAKIYEEFSRFANIIDWSKHPVDIYLKTQGSRIEYSDFVPELHLSSKRYKKADCPNYHAYELYGGKEKIIGIGYVCLNKTPEKRKHIICLHRGDLNRSIASRTCDTFCEYTVSKHDSPILYTLLLPFRFVLLILYLFTALVLDGKIGDNTKSQKKVLEEGKEISNISGKLRQDQEKIEKLTPELKAVLARFEKGLTSCLCELSLDTSDLENNAEKSLLERIKLCDTAVRSILSKSKAFKDQDIKQRLVSDSNEVSKKMQHIQDLHDEIKQLAERASTFRRGLLLTSSKYSTSKDNSLFKDIDKITTSWIKVNQSIQTLSKKVE
ncbi:MAG: hypothetical protein SNF33_02460 [Candidatus Algichlamydia australiensis]|nr:hypothetical protein [Chlamydiales bacterium]